MGVIYKLTPFAKTRRGLPGVPWRDLTPEEYAAALERHPGMEEHGYFEQAEEEDSTPPSSSRRGRTTTSDGRDDSQTRGDRG
jgi:hypothetical protein